MSTDDEVDDNNDGKVIHEKEIDSDNIPDSENMKENDNNNNNNNNNNEDYDAMNYQHINYVVYVLVVYYLNLSNIFIP